MDWQSLLLSLLGGVLIGTAGAMLLLFNGRIAGISGILGGVLNAPRFAMLGEWLWRALFIAGLLAGGFTVYAFSPASFAVEVFHSWPLVVVGGLLVGFGSRLGSGCTSGHGVCGISRLSMRSLVATGTFTATGAVTVYLLNHWPGGL